MIRPFGRSAHGNTAPGALLLLALLLSGTAVVGTGRARDEVAGKRLAGAKHWLQRRFRSWIAAMTNPIAEPPPSGASGGRLADQRVAYDDATTDPVLLPTPTPLELFETWYAEVAAAGLPEPNAMVLATVDAEGAPCSRTVLLKGVDERGFTFYTNLRSRKAVQISSAHGRVAITFPWHGIYRQVHVRGTAQLLEHAEVAEYFGTRPWGSRVGAWASHQSQPLLEREELVARWRELGTRWPDTGSPDDVPLPEHWGGYLVRPWEIEFWAGRPSRLHDRLVYTARDLGVALTDAEAWVISRRQP